MRRLTVSLSFFAALCLLFSCKDNDSPGNGNEDPSWPKDSVRVIVNTGISRPWEILWGPDNFIWMTERIGRISRVNPLTGEVKRLLTVPDVVENGEGGLLGMVLHPNFAQTPHVFISYCYNGTGGYREKVVRYSYIDSALSAPTVIIDNIPASGIHNGSRLLISPDLKLWMTTGDANVKANAQSTTSLSGKVLRMNLDGSIPADNPYPNSAIWSIGHRNPQGLVMANGILYEAEHGEGVEDEVNIIEKQRNYGWPTVEGPCSSTAENIFCTANNVKEPIWSTGGGTFALSGMDYYNNDRIPQWKNSILQVSLKNTSLYQLQLSTDGRSVSGSKTYFAGVFGRLRDVCVSPAGRVYLCTDDNNGKIIEISKPE